MTLTESEVTALGGIDEQLSIREVEEVYLPLCRLLNLHIAAVQELHRVTTRFLGSDAPRVPYVIAVAGSVSVGKSTTSRVLRLLLSRWEEHRRVDLVTTDGFLFPNRMLEERGIMQRKGFPESYDRARLLRFVSELKSGVTSLAIPLYSHFHYDVLDQTETIEQPEILILEGLNVLQSGAAENSFVSDFVDFSIYVDASETELESWFLDRFRRLRETAFRDPESYFRKFSSMPEEEAMAQASDIWQRINLANLRENILPTRNRARLILRKTAGHAVDRIALRRL